MEDTLKFDRKVAENRHHELLSALNNLAEKPSSDNGMKAAMEAHTGSLKEVASAIGKMTTQKPENQAPQPNNNDAVVKTLENIHNRISQHLDDVKKYMQPKNYTHTIVRNRAGLIDSINSKAD